MKANFNRCMTEILKHEGGYVDHPRDPGGATNMGITHLTLSKARGRKVTKADVKALSRKEAIDIYRRFYADPIRFNDLPAGLDFVTLDPTINSGAGRGVRWLQVGIGMTGRALDGAMGPKTLAAAKAAKPIPAIEAACRARMGFLRGLRTWTTFGKGWSRRVAGVEAFATALAVEAAGQPVERVSEARAEAADRKAKTEATRGAGAAVGGGGGISVADLPDWGLIAVGAALLVVLIMIWGQRRHEQNRAAAFRAMKEV